jgi:hypothetical protein
MTEIIVAPTLEDLRAELNRLHDKGVPLDQIAWWGWDLETIETRMGNETPYCFSPGPR